MHDGKTLGEKTSKRVSWAAKYAWLGEEGCHKGYFGS